MCDYYDEWTFIPATSVGLKSPTLPEAEDKVQTGVAVKF